MSYDMHKELVRGAFENFVMVNHSITKHFKDSNPAFILGYFVSEEKYSDSSGKLDKHGYFYCKADKIKEKFGFTRRVQDAIIEKLVDAELIEVFLKRIEGSTSLSKVRHIKVMFTNVYNLVEGIKIGIKTDNYAPDLIAIKKTLVSLIKDRGATFVETEYDEKILEIAKLNGLCPEIIEQLFNERHKRLKSKRVTLKYVLTALIPNIANFENQTRVENEVYQLLVT